jgi:ribosomal-protein-serine acetyltransferase
MTERLRFSALRAGAITLHRITEANAAEVRRLFSGFGDSAYMLAELESSYLPEYDAERRQTAFGFYATLYDTLAGCSILGVSSWSESRGFTGADTFFHMRGRGVAPHSKPLLFYLGFEVLGLHRIETGCFASNPSSRRSIEKTPGFIFEGTLREYARNATGQFEDEHRYAILKSDWQRLYDRNAVEVVP